MLKRKLSHDITDVDSGPLAQPSIFADDPTRFNLKRKRLFRSKTDGKRPWTPPVERSMSELLQFILQHEEAFKNQFRIASLYADFRQQLNVNPEGYQANVAAWIKALTDAARAGVVPGSGTTHDLLSIRASDELARALRHSQYGVPACLSAVFFEAVQKKDMILLKDFISSRESIYKTSWVPSPWKILQWSLRQVGILGQPQPSDKLQASTFVVVRNVEAAADDILKKMQELSSTADRVLSRADFMKRFADILNPTAPLTKSDLETLLVFLARDKLAISYNADTIKFKTEHEQLPLPVTKEDTAVANLRDTLTKIQAQIPPLMMRITAAEAAAREAVGAKQMIRAKAALRSKKTAEMALAERSNVALQLESVYSDLQRAADQVEIVEAMRAGAAALKSLNEQVGGTEGVQGVVDAVNEQMAMADEISNTIHETITAVDEFEIDEEFEALEKAEKDAEEQAEAAKTATRLAELEEAERNRKEREGNLEKLRHEALQKGEHNVHVEEKVGEASQQMSQLTVHDRNDENLKDAEQEIQVLLPT